MCIRDSKEALHFFSGVPKIVEKLRVLDEVGLGYLRLGQSATTLSGGEVVAVGTPEAIAQAENSYTGQWLARILPPNGNPQSHDHP